MRANCLNDSSFRQLAESVKAGLCASSLNAKSFREFEKSGKRGPNAECLNEKSFRLLPGASLVKLDRRFICSASYVRDGCKQGKASSLVGRSVSTTGIDLLEVLDEDPARPALLLRPDPRL